MEANPDNDDVSQLIHSLAEEMEDDTPRLPFHSYGKMVLFALLILAIYATAAMQLTGLRDDFHYMFQHEASYSVEIGLLLLTVLGNLQAAILAGFPDFRGRKVEALAAAFIPLGGTFLFYGSQLFSHWPDIIWGHHLHGLSCCFHMSAMALLPALGLSLLLRKLASTQPAITGIFVAISASAAGALLLRLHEPIDWAGHIILWHYLPISAFAFLGAILGPKILRW